MRHFNVAETYRTHLVLQNIELANRYILAEVVVPMVVWSQDVRMGGV